MNRILVVACALALLAPTFLAAMLGEIEATARAKQDEWRKEFGAVTPMFETDSSGRVIFECWTGPPEGWDQSTALRFAQRLLPEHVRRIEPKRINVEESNHAFEVTSDYRIYLSGLREVVYHLKVLSTKYRGTVACSKSAHESRNSKESRPGMMNRQDGVGGVSRRVEGSGRSRSGCCKICKTGKACGNSCISRSKTCHKPRGCACNG